MQTGGGLTGLREGQQYIREENNNMGGFSSEISNRNIKEFEE